MTSIIKLQAFSGVQDESPLCFLLQVDEFRFLLDCGWDEKFDKIYIKELKKHVHQIDAILLSYPDIFHLGALPYMVGKCGLNCPIYATIPVYKMGQMFMYDLFQSRHNSEDFDLFTLDDVDAAFDKIQQIKYSQNILLKGKGHGLQITPLPAGHMIGGTIWRIVKEGEEEIVYAVDYNHKKERHLNGCVLESINRPSLLITDAFNATYVQARRRLRDEQLMTNILQTLRNNGNVLIAVDTAGRVLELAQLLDQLWRNQDSGLLAYSLALLNNVSYNVVEFAKSQVEWMSDKIMRSFEDRRNNPFQFRHLMLCHSMNELAKVPEPKVVLASEPDMESGFSRDLFLDWCRSPKNSIILTSRTSPGTLARDLIDNPKLKTLFLDIKKRVRLEGSDLEEYLRHEKEKELEAARIKAEMAKNILMDGIDSSDDSENEMEIDMATFPIKGKHDLMRRSESKSRGGFFKQAKKSYPMFPVHEEKIRWDDYGEIIRTEDYTIMELSVADEDKLKENGVSIDETVQDISEVPTKCVSSTQPIDILAKVEFIDFEGRSDGESIRKIISQIKPRQLIIVHGSQEATKYLADYCRNTSGVVQGKVFTPKLHEIIDVTTESHIYQVKLKDSLVSSLMFAKAKDAELAWVDGQISLVKGHDLSSTIKEHKLYEEDDFEDEPFWIKREPNTDEDIANIMEETTHIPVLDALPVQQVSGHSAVFVNEPKLSDFKQILMRHNIQAEFSGGVLICNSVIAVRKTETGRIGLEGCICDDYYKVRELLYDQYAIL